MSLGIRHHFSYRVVIPFAKRAIFLSIKKKVYRPGRNRVNAFISLDY